MFGSTYSKSFYRMEENVSGCYAQKPDKVH